MKNNLLKSVAAAATASALLFSTVTSFAATATTVTKYNATSKKVDVTSSISGVAENTMVTYLASKAGTVKDAEDIVYIGQKTIDSTEKAEFSYTIDAGEVGKVLAQVKYGSNVDATATALNNGDTSTTVQYGKLTTSGYGCDITAPEYIGNGEENVEVTVTPKPGYELKLVSVNGSELTDAATALTQKVDYKESGMEFVAVCAAKTDENATTPTVVSVREVDAKGDESQIGLVCHVNNKLAGYKYGVYAKTTGSNAPFSLFSDDGFLEAVQVDDDGFFAVQILDDKEDGSVSLGSLTLVPACKIEKDGTSTIYTFDAATGNMTSVGN